MNKNNIKDYSRKISERMWNLPDKGEPESHREETYIDDIIQKSHIERKKHGCRVTHFDISQKSYDMVVSFDAPISYTYPNTVIF